MSRKIVSQSKARAQTEHARRRAAERFGISIDDEVFKRKIAEIQSGEAPFIWKTSNRVSVYQIELAGKPCKAVFDCIRKTIVTFLPMDYQHEVGGTQNNSVTRRNQCNREVLVGETVQPISGDTDPEI